MTYCASGNGSDHMGKVWSFRLERREVSDRTGRPGTDKGIGKLAVIYAGDFFS